VKRLETGQDVLIGNVCRKAEAAQNFLGADQLLQVEQQALSQPAKGSDFFEYRFVWALQRRRNRDEKAVQNRQASFSVGCF